MTESGGSHLAALLEAVMTCDGTVGRTKAARVKVLNDLAKVVRASHASCTTLEAAANIVGHVQFALLSSSQEVRAGGLRVLRYILVTKKIFQVMLDHCIDQLVVRSIDLSTHKEVERVQAVRFIQQAILVAPDVVPSCFASVLVSIATGDHELPDNFGWACAGLLCQLLTCNVTTAVGCGAVRALTRRLLCCQNIELSESVSLVLLHLFNQPDTRCYLRMHSDLLVLLAPITDVHYEHDVNEWENARQMSVATAASGRNDEFQLRVEASCIVLATFLKSWSGLMCLAASPNGSVQSALTSVVESLPLVGVNTQNELLEMFYCVFHLRVPTWTDNYSKALTSIDSSQPLDQWTLSEGFVAEEGRCLLPPITAARPDLVKCFDALLLSTLIDAKLLKSLALVCLAKNAHLAVRAAILLGELIHLAHCLLPGEMYKGVHCLPEIVTAAMNFEDHEQRNRAGAVISCLDRLHQMRKARPKASSLYLEQIMKQGLLQKHSSVLCSLPRDIDEGSLSSLIKSSQVLATKDYETWDWNLLQCLLQLQPLCYKRLEENLRVQFFNRLYNFYKPKNKVFSSIPYSPANSRKYSRVGYQLVQFLAKDEEELAVFVTGLATDIIAELDEVSKGGHPATLSEYNVDHTLSRDYLLLLGCLSHHKPAILAHCKGYGPLFAVCAVEKREDLHKLILSSLDFTWDGCARAILNRLLTGGSPQMRLYATKQLRVFLRSRSPMFKSWGMEVLTTQLYDTDEDVAMEALDVLDEACEEESYLLSLLHLNPALLHLSDKGVSFLTRFFSTRKGLARMQQLGFLEAELTRWHDSHNSVYVGVVEELLSQAFTSYRHTKEDEYVRRNLSSNAIRVTALVPIHLYGQLALHPEGCAILQRSGHIEEFASVIRDNIESCEDVTKVKATVWALAHIGTSTSGLELLMDEGVVHDLVRMAETQSVLSVRGTCFYALCLISHTHCGANLLEELGWVPVRQLTTTSKLSTATSTFSAPTQSPSEAREAFPSQPLSTLPSVTVETDMNDTPPFERTIPVSQTNLVPPGRSVVLRQQKKDSNLQPFKKRLSLSFTSGFRDALAPTLSAPPGVHTTGKRETVDDLNMHGGLHASNGSTVVYKNSQLAGLEHEDMSSVYGTMSRSALQQKMRRSSSKQEGLSSPSGSQVAFSPCYIGVCLPKKKETLLQVPPTEFRDVQLHCPPSEPDQFAEEGLTLHSRSLCLKCRLSASRACQLTQDATTDSMQGDERSHKQPSSEERVAVRKEALKLISKLSGDIAAKASKQGLKILFEKFPWAAQDLCLYSQAVQLLSKYRYSFSHRRYVQEMFRSCDFDDVFRHQMCVSSTPSGTSPPNTASNTPQSHSLTSHHGKVPFRENVVDAGLQASNV